MPSHTSDPLAGALRYYTYGAAFFNYGMLPQTWEDPSRKSAGGHKGDNDPLDVMEIGSAPFKVGEMRAVKVLGDLELIDQGELDHKIIVIDAADPLADRLESAADLPRVMPGVLEKLVDWLKNYKTTDGKEVRRPPSRPSSRLASCVGLSPPLLPRACPSHPLACLVR